MLQLIFRGRGEDSNFVKSREKKETPTKGRRTTSRASSSNGKRRGSCGVIQDEDIWQGVLEPVHHRWKLVRIFESKTQHSTCLVDTTLGAENSELQSHFLHPFAFHRPFMRLYCTIALVLLLAVGCLAGVMDCTQPITSSSGDVYNIGRLVGQQCVLLAASLRSISRSMISWSMKLRFTL